MTKAFGGVENGEAKQRLAPNVTAKRNGTGLTPTGLTPTCKALLIAIGAMSTAVAVLLMNIVRNDVVKYIPAISNIGL